MNVSDFITEQSVSRPNKQAIVELSAKSFFSLRTRKGNSCTFDELEKRINITANSLVHSRITQKTKVLVFIPPGIDFMCVTFALLKIGAVPVFIDPGMGKEKLLECIKKVKADALIGISKIFYLKKVSQAAFESVKTSICIDSSLWGDYSLDKLKKNASNQLDSVQVHAHDLSAILFTSGATGDPKGVEYRMEMFVNQVMALKEVFSINSTDNDFGGFPLFSLFTICMGATSFVPASIDPKAPAKTPPNQLVKELKESRISLATGSPSIWSNLISFCEKKKITLDGIKTLIMFGAPVSGNLIRKLSKIMPQARIYTPYGATESLPLSIIESQSILGETFEFTELGKGVCVGYPLRNVDVKILPITDVELKSLKEKPLGEVGEIAVSSPMTSHAYHLFAENNLSKIKHNQKMWHRMGDVGYFDDWGRLWYMGRKKHLVRFEDQNYYSVSVEGIFNSHPDVEKSALVTIQGAPAIALILKAKSKFLSANEKEELRRKFSLYAQRFDETRAIKRFELIDEFPLDTRHNIKIDRLALSKKLDVPQA